MALIAWMLRRELARDPPTPLRSLVLETLPGSPWVLKASAPMGNRVPETLEAVQKVLTRLREKRITQGELNAARGVWNAERQSQPLHPRMAAEALFSRVQEGRDVAESVGNLKPEALQSLLQNYLDPAACAYLVAGSAAGDAPLLEKMNLGPVAIVK